MEQFSMLGKIYNTMLMIETHGESTIYMGECLKAMREILSNVEIENMKNKIQNSMMESQNPEKGE